MAQTAMQEAIEYLKLFNLEASANILEDRFLEKEKGQIIDAYCLGDHGYGPDDGTQERMAKEYYNETYNQ